MIFRRASREEFQVAVEWAAGEGWNPGLDDAEVFWVTDPEGFVCAERDGEMVATGSVVSYGSYGFMGFFIVRPDLRGQGIGREFWNWRRDLLLERLGPGGVIGMDGVFEMQPFYAKGGFEFSHRNLRMEGVGVRRPVDPRVVSLQEVDLEEVADYDTWRFGLRRAEFLRRWISMPHARGHSYREDGVLRGLGVIRECRSGFKIGPLFADDGLIAEQLFVALSVHADGQPLFLDVPEINEQAVALARNHGMQEVFGCARMYHGEPVSIPLGQVFGVTTFELG
ncbi:MAG: GNAT family N-acetyltransferase [Verrucomicrobiaceae bacterium]|nr:GNAT family N-acetyltransferase [Verrucomicrobiaceae bacterium]